MTINTVIFDLDGTLLNTLDDLTDSVNNALSKFDYPLKNSEQVRNAIGNGAEELIGRVIPQGTQNPHFIECVDLFKKYYSDNMFNKTRPYDGIMELLEVLKSNGYSIAIVSNKFDSATKELGRIYFNNVVDYVIGQSETIPPKPAPESVFKTMEVLGKTPEECIYVGDSEVDIQTANNAGIPCVSVIWGYKTQEFLYSNGATMFIYSPEELLDMV